MHTASFLRNLLIISALLVVAVCCLLVYFLASEDITVSSLKDGRIKGGRITVCTFGETRDIVVTLDRDLVEDVLGALEPNEIDTDPPKWQEFASLEVEIQNGAMHEVELFRTGESFAAFRFHGKYYRGGSEKRLMNVVDQITHTRKK